MEADIVNTATKLAEEAGVTFSKKTELFRGMTKKVTFLDSNRAGENASESKEVVTTVSEKLGYVAKHLVKAWDILLKKERTNQNARADVVVDGVLIAKDVPATFLLGMETRLKALRPLLEAIPTLEPSIKWSEDAALAAGVFRAPETASFKTEKTVRHKILVEATKEHKAEIEKWFEDVPVARIDTTQFSGMWSSRQKAEVLDRLDRLAQAIKAARQRANMTDVVTDAVGDTLFAYVLG